MIQVFLARPAPLERPLGKPEPLALLGQLAPAILAQPARSEQRGLRGVHKVKQVKRVKRAKLVQQVLAEQRERLAALGPPAFLEIRVKQELLELLERLAAPDTPGSQVRLVLLDQQGSRGLQETLERLVALAPLVRMVS